MPFLKNVRQLSHQDESQARPPGQGQWVNFIELPAIRNLTIIKFIYGSKTHNPTIACPGSYKGKVRLKDVTGILNRAVGSKGMASRMKKSPFAVDTYMGWKTVVAGDRNGERMDMLGWDVSQHWLYRISDPISFHAGDPPFHTLAVGSADSVPIVLPTLVNLNQTLS